MLNFTSFPFQDAIDLFLGNFIVDPANLPATLETTLIALDQNGLALIAAAFAMAMTVLCVLVAGSHSNFVFKQTNISRKHFGNSFLASRLYLLHRLYFHKW